MRRQTGFRNAERSKHGRRFQEAFAHVRIFKILHDIILWLINNPDRPSVSKTGIALFVLLIAPYFSLLALVLLPAAVLHRPVPDKAALILAHLPDAGLTTTSLWAGILAVAIPSLYIMHGVLTYWGRRRLLRLSMEFQKALARRVARHYRDEIANSSRASTINAAAARRLIMADARYLARAYLALSASLPALATALIGFAILLWLVPGIIASIIAVLVLFLPLQAYVASEGNRFSSGFLEQAARYGGFLSGTFRAVSLLPFPQSLPANNLGAVVTGRNGDGFFDNYQERTRIGYLGEFSSQLTIAVILLVLILAFYLFPYPATRPSAEYVILILVAARYFFSSTSAVTQTVIGLGNSYPYYRNYLARFGAAGHRACVIHSKNILGDNSSPELSDQPIEAASTGEMIGLVNADGGSFGSFPGGVSVLQRGDDGLVTHLSPANFIKLGEPTEGGSNIASLHERLPTLSRLWDEAAALPDACRVEQMADDLTRRACILHGLAAALESDTIRFLAIDQREFRRFKQSERVAICRALGSAGMVMLTLNDDGKPFVQPFPDRLFALDINNGGQARSREVSLAEANEMVFGAKLTKSRLPQDNVVTVLADNPVSDWHSLADLFPEQSNTSRAGKTGLRMVAPAPAEIVTELGEAQRKLRLGNLSDLKSRLPDLSHWWQRVAELYRPPESRVGHAADRETLPETALLLGLAMALERSPEAIALGSDDFAKLTKNERELLLAGLEKASIRIFLWHLNTKPIPSFLPQPVLHLLPGQRFRLEVIYNGKPARTSVRTLSRKAVLTLPTGKVEIGAAPLLGIVVNQPTMTWTEIAYFLSLVPKVGPFSSGDATLIGPPLFDDPTAIDLMTSQARAVDLCALSVLYRELATEWWALWPYLEALARGQSGEIEALLADASPGTRFWLTAAFALSGKATALFVRERDLRLIPQIGRTRLAVGMKEQTLVIWKDDITSPFVLPRPEHVLIVNNGGIMSAMRTPFDWNDLSADLRRQFLRKRFAPEQADAADFSTDEDE